MKSIEDICALFNSLNISYELIRHPAVHTIGELSKLNLKNADLIAKNLFLRDDKKKSFYIVTMCAEKQADLKELRKAAGCRPLSFASQELLFNKLGLKQGEVTPLGVLNNVEKDVVVIFDEDLIGKTIGIHPDDNTATVFLKLSDLVKIIEKSGNNMKFIHI